jgi:hypothetical protein
MTIDYRKNFRVILTVGKISVTGMGKTMPQAYADAVRQNPNHDWKEPFQQARSALKRAINVMGSETVSGDLRVEIRRPWF